MLQCIAIITLDDLKNMSYRAMISILSDLGQTISPVFVLEIIHANLCGFHPSLRQKEGESTWGARRDEISFVSDFEHVSFSASKCLLPTSSSMPQSG